MTNFILSLVNMSLVSGWIIIILLVLRPFMKKIPRSVVCGLWLLAGIRLVFPVGFESFLSLIPDSEPLTKEIISSQADYLAGLMVSDSSVSVDASVTSQLAVSGENIDAMGILTTALTALWAVGFAVMITVSVVSYIRLNNRVKPSFNIGNNVYINDDISSPFVLGFIRPRIYIPSNLTEYETRFVTAHENAHIRRRDYLIKPIGYLILSLHWFNPLVWVSYIFLCRDIESACDQRVIRDMDEKGKKDYSEILLRLSVTDRRLRACPVAFGEVGVKSRIKSVLSYKKPAVWVVAVAVVISLVLSMGFLTNPVKAYYESAMSDYRDVIGTDEIICTTTASYDYNKAYSEIDIPAVNGDNAEEVFESTPYIAFNANSSEHYYKKSSVESDCVYNLGEVSLLSKGTYFILNKDSKTFAMVYEKGDELKMTSGNYEVLGSNLILMGKNDEIGSMVFVNSGDDFVYSEASTKSYNGFTAPYFNDGDRFVFEV